MPLWIPPRGYHNMDALFDNAAALAKLAALNPPPPSSASTSASTLASTSHARKEGKRTTAGTQKDTAQGRIGVSFDLAAEPAWLKSRLALLAQIKERNSAASASLEKAAITVRLPDGKEMAGVAWQTSPFDIAAAISKGLANATCVASVRYSKRYSGAGPAVVNADSAEDEATVSAAAVEWELWDAVRPLEGDCELKLHKFDEPEGKDVFWHSSAHILGEALESLYSAQLTHGPATDTGFFYDSFLGGNPFKPEMGADVEKKVTKICNEKQPFERVVITKEDALQLFANNPFKLAMIRSKLPDGCVTTAYACGPFVDLCRGPHLPNTGKIKAFAVTKTSASLWLGKQGNDELQRTYGITFPDKKDFTEWKHLQEEAAKRDHRVIGLKQELFFFDELSPGSCFFLPHGGRLWNKLQGAIREQLWVRGYDEVVTPNMYNLKLWETSGHAAKYKENMFCLDIENAEFGLKPMNCPGHCLMFKMRKRSYRELPIRLADFGVLHRNELSGALTGLTRVRRFQQDDAHIFCMVSQIKSEVRGCLEMIKTVYDWLGMDFALKLSTRPEGALGDPAVWEMAEAYMADALDEFQSICGKKWSLNPGDGAFYGPKIDVQVFDALKRPHQCATVQLDFVQPMRFDLRYMAGATAETKSSAEEGEGEAAGFERPVMIHRAVYGSFERMIAILVEHFAGKWPFWMSPRQCLVVPVSKAFLAYATAVKEQIYRAGYYADADLSCRTLNKMVREGQLAYYNFILVVGAEEAESESVNVRTRENEVQGKKTVVELLDFFAGLTRDKK
uniref:Probable threonine--tRNA ligase, cytoplasmic n=1 Tax=Calcidiscus leptoporus TaxID=127549 RepID=A0A7S0IKQ1_9EUKA